MRTWRQHGCGGEGGEGHAKARAWGSMSFWGVSLEHVTNACVDIDDLSRAIIIEGDHPSVAENAETISAIDVRRFSSISPKRDIFLPLSKLRKCPCLAGEACFLEVSLYLFPPADDPWQML